MTRSVTFVTLLTLSPEITIFRIQHHRSLSYSFIYINYDPSLLMRPFVSFVSLSALTTPTIKSIFPEIFFHTNVPLDPFYDSTSTLGFTRLVSWPVEGTDFHTFNEFGSVNQKKVLKSFTSIFYLHTRVSSKKGETSFHFPRWDIYAC